MAEYIEREKAFYLIKEQKEKETGAYSKGRNKGLIIAGSIINNKEVLPTAEVAEVKWIDVNERPPKNNLVRVLVFLKDNEFTKPIGFNRIDTDRFIDGKWVRWGEHVTHWMPLPEPPSEKEGEQR